MKKSFTLILVAALVMMSSCKKNDETKSVTLKASIEQHKSDGSKTSLNPNDLNIAWTMGDKILVNNGTSSVPFTLSGNGGATGTFVYNGEYTFGENNVAVYPETATVSGTTVSLTLPTEQDLDEPNGFANGANPMLATFTDANDLTFTSLCGALGLQLTGDNIPITAIEIISKADEKLNGTFECTTTDPTLRATSTNSGTNGIKLNCTTTLTSEAKKFYIVLPVGSLSNGFFMNVYDGDNVIFDTDTDTDLTTVLNTVKTMNVLEVNTTPVSTIPEGAINGLFTINANGDQVYFSKGNLQYIGSATTPYWKFADNQWDYLGDNGQISDSQTVDRDLFCWGTSGYNHGATAYQPWSTSTNYRHYYVYGDASANLFDQNGQADWGYNAINNGGNQENSGWRTLTQPEWDYVFNSRTTISGIHYAKAKVNNVNGVILLPDSWDASMYALNETDYVWGGYVNNITASDWANILEANGAVFLPATGYRYGTSEYSYVNSGIYWSATHQSTNGVRGVNFNDGYLDTYAYDFRYEGYCVRLARNAE